MDKLLDILDKNKNILSYTINFDNVIVYYVFVAHVLLYLKWISVLWVKCTLVEVTNEEIINYIYL